LVYLIHKALYPPILEIVLLAVWLDNLKFKETNLGLAKTDNGNYKVKNLPVGMYIINIIADLSSEQNPEFSHSLHRFAVKVATTRKINRRLNRTMVGLKTGRYTG
jgi:hypothetical protein